MSAITTNYSRKFSRELIDFPRMALKDIQSENKESLFSLSSRPENITKAQADSPSEKPETNDHPGGEKSYVGYSNLPNQIYRKAVRKGFHFNMMIVGTPGVGKSTLINSLLLSDFYEDKICPKHISVDSPVTRTHSVLIKEKSISLKLSLVDCPGFGEFINNSDCWKPIVSYVENAYYEYMLYENKVERIHLKNADKRIHACLYCLPPTSQGLSKLDLEFLRSVHDKMNIILLIGRSDTLSKSEVAQLKQRIRDDLAKHGIKVYKFPPLNSPHASDELSQKFAKNLAEYQSPFAVVGACTTLTNTAGKQFRGRKYPWGTVELENLEHSDFAMLRHLLLSVNMQDLIDSTHHGHYQKYRSEKIDALARETNFSISDDRDPMLLMDAEKKQHDLRLSKMELDIEAVFEQKLAEKTEKLRQYEASMMREMENLADEVASMEAQLDQERAAFEAERLHWEEAQRADCTDSKCNGDSGTLPLGDRVLGELMRERSKSKKRGMF